MPSDHITGSVSPLQAALVLIVVAAAIGVVYVAYDSGASRSATERAPTRNPATERAFRIARPTAVPAALAGAHAAFRPVAHPGAATAVADDRWHADESAGGTQPDAQH